MRLSKGEVLYLNLTVMNEYSPQAQTSGAAVHVSAPVCPSVRGFECIFSVRTNRRATERWKWQMLPTKMRQVPNKSEESDFSGKHVWRELSSREMAKSKFQIAAWGMSKQIGHRTEGLMLHEESWQFEREGEQVTPRFPPHSILICTATYLM